MTRDFCIAEGKGIAPRAGTTQRGGLPENRPSKSVEVTDTRNKEKRAGHGGHDQLPTKIIPRLSRKVKSKCPIKRTE